jgi:ABC-type uncharacterized transport system ATPase subunit
LLVLHDISKVYDNGVIANKNIAMEFQRREIHALLEPVLYPV